MYVQAITQSRDGFLWLGSYEGLFRFDGIAFEKIPSLAIKPTRSDSITALLGASSGDIWVGHYWGGVSVYRNGKLMDANPAPPTGGVYKIVEDKFGAIWVWSDGAHFASLRRYADGKWTILDRSWGLPQAHASDIMAARNGDLWLGFSHQLAILPHGARRLKWIDEPVGMEPRLAETSTGEILVADRGSVRTPAGARPNRRQTCRRHGATATFERFSCAVAPRSRWVAMAAKSREQLERIAHPAEFAGWRSFQQIKCPETSTRENPGSLPTRLWSFLRIAEGDIWIGTDAGIDRFRPMNIVPVLGLSDHPTVQTIRIVGSKSGRVFGLAFEEGGARPFKVEPGNIVETVQPSRSLATPLCASRDGGAWFVGFVKTNCSMCGKIRSRKYRSPACADPPTRNSCVETEDGTLWISLSAAAPLRFNGTSWKQFAISPAQNDVAWSMGQDRHGGALIYVPLKYLVDIRNDSVRVLWRQKDIPIGLISVISTGPNATLLGGEQGLARYDGKTIRVLGADRFPIFGHITGIVQSRRGQTWILSRHCLILMSSLELAEAFDHPGFVPSSRVFDFEDGFSGSPTDELANKLAEAADGRIWLLTSEGYFWIDPKKLRSNSLQPPVAIRSLTADGAVYSTLGSITLPSGTSNLQIDYSVLSLQMPERNRARYRLDGVDKAWVDSGSRRQTFYTNLGPGTYAFHVIASNDDGVWNMTGKTISFVVPPTFLQSKLFVVLCVLAGAVFLSLLYALRLRQVTAGIRSRMEERVSERERIARDLHDTLLQGIDGLIFRFQSIANRLRPDEPIRTLMDEALERADDVLSESRDSMKNLRPSQSPLDISDVFAATGDAKAWSNMGKFRVVSEGAVRKLHPIVRDEVARIGNEAIANAIKHSKAENIEVSVVYLRSRIVLTVTDDGEGISEDVLKHGRQGHFGLTGMRERAERIRANLSVSSDIGAGTTVTLIVPAAIAYADVRGIKLRSWLRNVLMPSCDL